MRSESRLVNKDCPDCGSDFLLAYKVNSIYGDFLYCPVCDTSFSIHGDELYALVKTKEPYADFASVYKSWGRN